MNGAWLASFPRKAAATTSDEQRSKGTMESFCSMIGPSLFISKSMKGRTMIDKFMRESEIVQSLKSISVFTFAFNYSFTMSIYSNLCFTLSTHVPRLSIRLKIIQSYYHCHLARFYACPFPFQSFPLDLQKASPLAPSATTTSTLSLSTAAAATNVIMGHKDNNNDKNKTRNNDEQQRQLREERERRRRGEKNREGKEQV